MARSDGVITRRARPRHRARGCVSTGDCVCLASDKRKACPPLCHGRKLPLGISSFVTPPFGLADAQVFNERPDRPELFLNRSLEFVRLLAYSRSTEYVLAYQRRAMTSSMAQTWIGESSLHRWRHATHLMHAGKVGEHEV